MLDSYFLFLFNDAKDQCYFSYVFRNLFRDFYCREQLLQAGKEHELDVVRRESLLYDERGKTKKLVCSFYWSCCKLQKQPAWNHKRTYSRLHNLDRASKEVVKNVEKPKMSASFETYAEFATLFGHVQNVPYPDVFGTTCIQTQRNRSRA